MFTLIALFACNSQKKIERLEKDVAFKETQIFYANGPRITAAQDCRFEADRYQKELAEYELLVEEERRYFVEHFISIDDTTAEAEMQTLSWQVQAQAEIVLHTKSIGAHQIYTWAEADFVYQSLRLEREVLCLDLLDAGGACKMWASPNLVDPDVLMEKYSFPDCPPVEEEVLQPNISWR